MEGFGTFDRNKIHFGLFMYVKSKLAHHDGLAVLSVRLRQLACCDGEFESRAGDMDVCLLWLLGVVQVESSLTGRSFVQGSLTVCSVLSVVRCNSNPLHYSE